MSANIAPLDTILATQYNALRTDLIAKVTAKGDVLAGTGLETADRIPVGANTRFLTADSTQASGIGWVFAEFSEHDHYVFTIAFEGS